MLIRSENLQITLSLESFSQNNNEIQSKILSQMFANTICFHRKNISNTKSARQK